MYKSYYKMKRFLTILAAAVLCVLPLRADEGMWLPALISQRIGDMQAKGFKLSAYPQYAVKSEPAATSPHRP